MYCRNLKIQLELGKWTLFGDPEQTLVLSAYVKTLSVGLADSTCSQKVLLGKLCRKLLRCLVEVCQKGNQLLLEPLMVCCGLMHAKLQLTQLADISSFLHCLLLEGSTSYLQSTAISGTGQ